MIDLETAFNACMDFTSEEIAVSFHYRPTAKQMMETATASLVSWDTFLIMGDVFVDVPFLISLIASSIISIETVACAKTDIRYTREDATDGNLLILSVRFG